MTLPPRRASIPSVTSPSGLSSQPGGRPLDSNWWARGLALHERAQGAPRTVNGSTDDLAWLSRWRAGYGATSAFGFDRRLADAGMDEKTMLALLAESPDSLAARVPRPAWVDTVEHAIRSAAPPSVIAEPPTTDWRAAFAVPLQSFVDNSVTRLVELASRVLNSRHADLPAIAGGFSTSLSRRLTRIAVRTLVQVHNEQRELDRSTSATGPEWLANFVHRQAEPEGLARLLTTYPVLARLLGQASQFATEATVELLTRFATDRQAIVDTLLDGLDPGRLVAIEQGAGDAHQRGRAVAIVSFADGRQVVYKPRDQATHAHFATIVGWLNRKVPEIGLRTPAIMVRPGYGWSEFIAARPLPDLDAAGRFYRKQGGLLALLYALHASDSHYENLIACGDQPVLVDVETLFHATFPRPGAAAMDPASSALAASVQRTGLLPIVVIGENGAVDVSGLGADAGQTAPRDVVDWELTEIGGMRTVRRTAEFAGARNRSRLGDRTIDPTEHESELLEGFRLGYEAITRHRTEFTTLLEACADILVRTVIRPTQGYATLLDESTQPDLLGDALDRDRALDLLWTESAHLPLCWDVARYELADLWAGDVPVFYSRPGSTDLWSSDGQRQPALLGHSGLANALDTVTAMGVEDRQRQEWIISAALACLRSSSRHLSTTPLPGEPVGTAATADRLLAAACALGDQILARSMANDDRTNWLSVELVEDQQWMVLPMGAGLANGYVGVALFLAQLAELSGIARYANVARQALSGIPRLHTTFVARPDLVQAVGCGGLHGFGGIAYGLGRIATLLADDDIRSWAHTAVDLAATAASASGSLDLATGLAGCLAAMSAAGTELASVNASQVAADCADRLAELALRTGGRCVAGQAAMPTGFASGTAGIGWALGRYAAIDGQQSHATAARLVLDLALSNGNREAETGPGWCSGTAGREAARLVLNEDPEAEGMDERRVQGLANGPLLRDFSLCHGQSGITEALIALAVAGRSETADRACRRHAGLILGATSRHGLSNGALDSVPTFGLLTGAAGVGYGLLRLGFPEHVPSVLLFEPTRPSGLSGINHRGKEIQHNV